MRLPELPPGHQCKTKNEMELYRQNMLFREVQHFAKLVHIDGRVDLTVQLTMAVERCEEYIKSINSAWE